MAILMRNSVFIHLPKTGGRWVESAIKAGGISHTSSRYLHYVPAPEEIGDRWIFVSVRNPTTWLTSLFHHRKRRNWSWDHPNAHEIDKLCKAYDLETFIRNVISYPGIVERHFDTFTSKYEIFPKYVVGRTESLRDDLIHFLEAAEEQFNADAIRCLPNKNTGGEMEPFPEHLVAPLRNSERRLFDKYDY